MYEYQGIVQVHSARSAVSTSSGISTRVCSRNPGQRDFVSS